MLFTLKRHARLDAVVATLGLAALACGTPQLTGFLVGGEQIENCEEFERTVECIPPEDPCVEILNGARPYSSVIVCEDPLPVEDDESTELNGELPSEEVSDAGESTEGEAGSAAAGSGGGEVGAGECAGLTPEECANLGTHSYERTQTPSGACFVGTEDGMVEVTNTFVTGAVAQAIEGGPANGFTASGPNTYQRTVTSETGTGTCGGGEFYVTVTFNGSGYTLNSDCLTPGGEIVHCIVYDYALTD